MIGSEGRWPVIEKASWFASSSYLSCWRGMWECQQQWCAGGVVPTRHCMRADLANSNGDATAPHVVGEGEGKGSAACRQAEGSRRIACGSRVIQVRRSARPATSTHRIGPSRTGLRSTGTGAGGGKRRRTALTRRARSPLAPDARHCSRKEQGWQSVW